MSKPRPQTSSPVQKGLAPIGGHYFPSVKRARAILMQRADEILSKYIVMIDMAVAAGDFETASKAYQFLIEHMPKEEGEAIIAESAAKPKLIESGHKGPIIQIGVRVGGTSKELPEPQPITIDVEPVS